MSDTCGADLYKKIPKNPSPCNVPLILFSFHFFIAEMAAVTAGPKRTRQTYTRYQTLELEKVRDPYQIPEAGAIKGT